MAGALLFLSGCDKDDPEPENIPEVITKAVFTFTPAGGGSLVIITATDPDGEGPAGYTITGAANFAKGSSYVLTMSLLNELADPSSEEYDITKEIKEEDDEHIFFFSFTNNAFSSPTGNGNIDNRNDPVNYGADDKDEKGLPVGLTTNWTAGSSNLSAGTFRVLLKHQPDIKSSTSKSDDGETDLDVSFPLNIN